MKFTLTALAVAALVCGVVSGSSQAQTVLYDANSGVNSSGSFSSATGGPGQHYLQQITLAGGAPSYTLTSFPVFGVRWNDITTAPQDIFLDFYTGVDLSTSSTNALASATKFASTGFQLSSPGANGSYNYTLTLNTPITTPSATFAIEVTMTNGAGNAYATGIAYRLSTGGAPTVGSNPGFVWIDTNANGIFTGAEQSASPTNIRMTISGSAVPEPSAAALAALGSIGVLFGARRLRRRR
jgi:hypothetical protein